MERFFLAGLHEKERKIERPLQQNNIINSTSSGCLPQFVFLCFFLLLAKFLFQSSFFSESRSFSRPLFCFFVLNLDPLAGQPIQIFHAIQISIQIFFRYLLIPM
jgi:hypothetical protein